MIKQKLQLIFSFCIVLQVSQKQETRIIGQSFVLYIRFCVDFEMFGWIFEILVIALKYGNKWMQA